MATQAHPRNGFTLIELLVVVAIITALLGMLLPSMGRSLEITRRAVCGSNQRQIVTGTNTYAADHQRLVPVGRASSLYHVNYWFVDNRDSLPGFYMFGSLYDHNVMGSGGEVWYCPSNTIEHLMYDQPNNVWPPEVFGPGATTQRTRAGYSMRPEHFVNFYSSTPLDMPTVQSFGRRVAFSDLVVTPDSVSAAHGDGVNAGRLDGSVGWVDLDQYDHLLKNVDPDTLPKAIVNGSLMLLYETLDRN